MIVASALTTGKLYSIDIVEHKQVKENVSKVKDKVELINGDSKKVKRDTSIDLLFIDGDHSYRGVEKDVNKFTPFLKKGGGGYLIMHDVIGLKAELQPVIDGLLKSGYREIDRADSMLVLEKEK